VSPAHLVSLPGEGEAPNRHGRTDRPCWRCRPRSEPTLVRFEGSYEDCLRARERASAAGTCVDVAIALSLELDQALTELCSEQDGATTTEVLERVVAETPVCLASDAKLRSWQRYLISGADEPALDQLPEVALPRSVAEASACPLRLSEFVAIPVSRLDLARCCEIIAAGNGQAFATVVASAVAHPED
jgi:hypothetical protein